MKKVFLKTFSLLLVAILTVCSLPVSVVDAAALTVEIDSINGSKGVSGSYIWTTGTFDANYWVAIKAAYVSYNVYAVEAIYPSGTKSVTVSGTDILLVVHTGHAQIANANKIAVGDILSLYNINLSKGTCNSGYVRVTSSSGLTLDSESPLSISYASKIISGMGLGTTVSALKTHFCEATDELVVKKPDGTVASDNSYIGTGYTIESTDSGAYTLKISGDLDGNAQIDTSDYMIMTEGLIKGSLDTAEPSGDVNGDGFINTSDALSVEYLISGKSVGITPALTVLGKVEPEKIVVPEKELHYHAKTFKLSETNGTHSGTVISNGKLTLASGSTTGTFITGVIDIGTFKKMVASWNAVTNGGTVSLAVSFEVTTGSWSSYFSWGTWSSTSGLSGSASPSNSYGDLSVDILSVSSSYTTTGKIKVKLTLGQYNGKIPTVENFSIATPQMAAQQTVNASALPTTYLNDVPMRSQLMSSYGSLGNIICSPTTTAMALEHLGTKVTTLTAAYAMYDNNWGAYGNWSYAAAYAGEHGYVAYIDFYDTEMIKYALSQGCVIGCSTSLTSSGHLVLVVGYTVKNGVEYFIVNDPNVPESKIARTEYSVSYFESVWRRSDRGGFGIAYVFQGVYDLNKK